MNDSTRLQVATILAVAVLALTFVAAFDQLDDRLDRIEGNATKIEGHLTRIETKLGIDPP